MCAGMSVPVCEQQCTTAALTLEELRVLYQLEQFPWTFPRICFSILHLKQEEEKKKQRETGLVMGMGEPIHFWVLFYCQEMQNNELLHTKSVQRMLWTFKHGFVCSSLCFPPLHY